MGWSLCPGKSKKKQNKKPNDPISSTSGTSMKEKKREQISVTLIILLKLNFNSYIPSAILFLKVCFFNVCVPLDTC